MQAYIHYNVHSSCGKANLSADLWALSHNCLPCLWLRSDYPHSTSVAPWPQHLAFFLYKPPFTSSQTCFYALSTYHSKSSHSMSPTTLATQGRLGSPLYTLTPPPPLSCSLSHVPIHTAAIIYTYITITTPLLLLPLPTLGHHPEIHPSHEIAMMHHQRS
jgi:hypothetical protein